ncbi:MAG: DUF2007 domain-containing protein [Actinomycetota bacterium]|nr:DUF2007 domain-containing protein [Actinomycetota bacterium]
MADLVEAGRFTTEFEALTALAVLESAGIDARMVTDNAGGALPSLSQLSGGVRILVRAEDGEDARDVLETEEPLLD